MFPYCLKWWINQEADSIWWRSLSVFHLGKQSLEPTCRYIVLCFVTSCFSCPALICHLLLICSDILTLRLLLTTGSWNCPEASVCCQRLKAVNQPLSFRPSICPPLHQQHLADSPMSHTESNVVTVPRHQPFSWQTRTWTRDYPAVTMMSWWHCESRSACDMLWPSLFRPGACVCVCSVSPR